MKNNSELTGSLKDSETVKVTVKFRLPTLPNFLVLAGSEHMSIPIHHATDAELRAIGEAWTDAMIERARRKRQCAKDGGLS